MTRVKLAELTSGVGALVLGIGLGALSATWIGSAAGFVTLAGLAVHAFGMWDKHRIENAGVWAEDVWQRGGCRGRGAGEPHLDASFPP